MRAKGAGMLANRYSNPATLACFLIVFMCSLQFVVSPNDEVDASGGQGLPDFDETDQLNPVVSFFLRGCCTLLGFVVRWHGYDHFPARVSLFEIPNGFSDLTQRVRPV